jgi:hypothetical protein
MDNTITADDIQEDFSIVFNCGPDLPACPLMKKFQTPKDIFEDFEKIKENIFKDSPEKEIDINIEEEIYFEWNLIKNEVTPCICSYSSKIVNEEAQEKFMDVYDDLHDNIVIFMKYQLQNAGIY